VPFTSHDNVRNYVEPKPFSWAKPAYVGFSSSNFTVEDHIWALLEMLSMHLQPYPRLLIFGMPPPKGISLRLLGALFRACQHPRAILHYTMRGHWMWRR
jgi:hypothetical protein